MAKHKPKIQKKTYSKIKDPKRPPWMRVLYWIAMILVIIFGVLVFAGALIKYIKLVSK